MKNTLYLFLAFCLSIQVQAKTIEKTYFFNDFQITNHKEYSLVNAPEAFNTALIGQPLLPWFASNIILAPGEEIVSVEFIGADQVQINGNYQLMPKQYAQPISKGKSGIYSKDQSIYNSNKAYPEAGKTTSTTQFWAGHGIGMVNYTPFVYYPKSGELYYYRQVTLVLHTENTPKAKRALQLLNAQAKEDICSFTENPEDLKSYTYPNTSKNTAYDYLIITPEAFISEFETLVDHYILRGMKTIIKSKEEILVEMNGQDAPEKIRNYIIQEYTNNNIAYVMLGGDVEHIPYRGFFCQVQSSSVYEDNNIPSDLYYSALDGNWNTDGDGNWGEIGEDDLLPEIAVARFSFSNETELASMLNKTITYQSSPVTGNLAHPLMAGEHLYDNPITWGSDYLELMIGYQNENGYETTGIPEDNTFTKLYDVNSSWSSSQLISEINQGKNFVHHVGHANETTVMKLYNGDINNANFSGANGVDHQFTNVYTHGCICGSFDANDCIAEYMVKIDNFAAAFIGNSRYGWFNEGQTEGPSAHIHREFVNALYTDSLHRIGMAHMASKYETAPWVNATGQHEEGALRWCFYDCNVLGDPAMSIWTAEPWEIEVEYPAAITIGQSNYEIEITSDGNAIEGLEAALIMENVIYAHGISNNNGQVTMNLDPVFTTVGTATLWISGFNCTPHSYEVQVIPASGAYMVLQACEINDEEANNNQLLDYDETVFLNISLENVGSDVASGVMAELSCSHPDIQILDGDAEFGDISGNTSINLDAAFQISVTNNIEDGTLIPFTMSMNSGDNTWESSLEIMAHAPAFEFLSFDIDDASGNNNGRLDPGETIDFSVDIKNNGSSISPDLNMVLNSSSSFISINNPSQNNIALSIDEVLTIHFEIEVDESAENGEIAQFNLMINAGAYEAYMSYLFAIGLQVEDWETGNFDQYDWQFDGAAPWTITLENPYEGENCSQSGQINDGQYSEMTIELEVITIDSISFYYKVSSEDNYDFLRFNIDENEMDKWSGEENWTRKAYVVATGNHDFTWKYSKDGSMTSGSDKAWIDYIVFPATGIISLVNDLSKDFNLQFYPNPVKETAVLEFQNKKAQILNLKLIDQNGKSQELQHQKYDQGQHQLQINLLHLSPGVYTLIIISENGVLSKRFVKF